MSAVKSFSLPDEAVLVLESIPKRERSDFVSKAILEAARQQSQQQAIAAISAFPRAKLKQGETVVELVRDIRLNAK